MPYKKILTVQDISCVGQCSLTVALPILSACGLETCILPSAVLSNHTAFSEFTLRDLAADIPAIHRCWQRQGICFEAVYTGYLGSIGQIDAVKAIFDTMLTENSVILVDPAMADNGKLYTGFDESYANAMKKLCFAADILLPNITEACLLTGTDYKEHYDRAYIDTLLAGLTAQGAKTVVLTGVSYNQETTGVAVLENGVYSYYEHYKFPKGSHGTGDVYASAFTGAYLNGKTALQAAKLAADYTLECLKNTQDDPTHWYGVKFETALPKLIQALEL